MLPKCRGNMSCLLTKSVFKLALKAFWTKIVPRLKAHPFSDYVQFMRLGIHGWLGVNEGKRGTCVAVNANPVMLPSPQHSERSNASMTYTHFVPSFPGPFHN